MARKKQQKPDTRTREMFSDSISQADVTTTNPPARDSSQFYLKRRPVNFIKVCVGQEFLLNGYIWRKESHETAIVIDPPHPIPSMNPRLSIAPDMLVFITKEP